MREADKKALVNRLRSARGHVDAVIRMVEDDTYCVDVMKQLSAVQGSLEAASRTMLRNHLETCVAAAMKAGRTTEIVDELMQALRFDRITTGPVRDEAPAAPAAAPAAEGCH
ncbi:MAG: CsoR family transcriptional regulator, copper-sensing transcriptional repressor [Actinomycetota bacterium]|nr:CsoR family transcriptional regulator, copper-sensing transcriptional repressor [Actinomycetota bacterium]